MARVYGNTTDKHRFTLVSQMQGAFSVGAWMKRNANGGWDTWYCRCTSANVAKTSLQIDEFNFVVMEITGSTERRFGSLKIETTDGWVFLGIDKAAGSVTPRAHCWKQASGWTHVNADGAMGNPETSGATATVRIGEWQGGTADNFSGEIEMVVEINGTQLTDGEWESAAFSRDGIMAQGPTGVWELRQSATSEKVRDLTGTGADEKEVSGTSVGTRSCPFYFAGGPPVYSRQPTASGKLLTLEITDSLAISDSITKVVGKAQSDSLPIADTVVKFTSRPLADALPLADQVGKAAGKPLSDSLAIADTVAKTPGKGLSDALPLADAVTKGSGKALADDVPLADQVGKKTGKALTDDLAIADSIGKKVGRVVEDALGLADQVVRRIGKGLIDLLGLADVLEATMPEPPPGPPSIDEPTGLTIYGGAGLELDPGAGVTIAAEDTGLQLGAAAGLELGPGGDVVLDRGNTSLQLDPGAGLEIDG